MAFGDLSIAQVIVDALDGRQQEWLAAVPRLSAEDLASNAAARSAVTRDRKRAVEVAQEDADSALATALTKKATYKRRANRRKLQVKKMLDCNSSDDSSSSTSALRGSPTSPD